MFVRMWRKGNLCALLVEMYIHATILENSMKFLQKKFFKVLCDPAIPHLYRCFPFLSQSTICFSHLD